MANNWLNQGRSNTKVCRPRIEYSSKCCIKKLEPLIKHWVRWLKAWSRESKISSFLTSFRVRTRKQKTVFCHFRLEETEDLVSDLQLPQKVWLAVLLLLEGLTRVDYMRRKTLVCVPLIPASKGARLKCWHQNVQ